MIKVTSIPTRYDNNYKLMKKRPVLGPKGVIVEQVSLHNSEQE